MLLSKSINIIYKVQRIFQEFNIGSNLLVDTSVQCVTHMKTFFMGTRCETSLYQNEFIRYCFIFST